MQSTNGYRLALELLRRHASQQIAYDHVNPRDSLVVRLLAGPEVDEPLAYLDRLGIESTILQEIHLKAAAFHGSSRARFFELLYWLSGRADDVDAQRSASSSATASGVRPKP